MELDEIVKNVVSGNASEEVKTATFQYMRTMAEQIVSDGKDAIRSTLFTGVKLKDGE